MKNPIYLDYNATTPICDEAIIAMQAVMTDCFGNPSSSHYYGQKAKDVVDEAREKVSLLLGCEPNEIVFTSGGTESNNYAIKGAAFANQHKGNHIITTQIEHPAVIEVCKFLQTKGFEVTYLPVDKFGIVSADDVADAITDKTILVSVMHANNETGAVQPIHEIGSITRSRGILFHVDAAQSIGKISVDVNELNVDLLSVAAHKFYGPKGVGALYIRSGVKLEKLMHGANHESGLRAGTENIILVAGLAAAADEARLNFDDNVKHMCQTRDALQFFILNSEIDCIVNGHLKKRLPNTLSVSFKGVLANDILAALPNIAASSGSACHSGCVEYSSVLKAMEVAPDYAMGTIRLSTGRFLTMNDVEFVSKVIVDYIKEIV